MSQISKYCCICNCVVATSAALQWQGDAKIEGTDKVLGEPYVPHLGKKMLSKSLLEVPAMTYLTSDDETNLARQSFKKS